MIRLSKEQKKCHECGATYIRLYQYLNHVSNIEGCGKNPINLNTLITVKSNEVLCDMYDRYISHNIDPPMVLSLYVANLRLQERNCALEKKITVLQGSLSETSAKLIHIQDTMKGLTQ